MEQIHPDQDYQAHLAAGRFMIQRSRSSGRHVFYPRVAEPGTGARDLEWVQASGRGTVYSTTVVRPKPPQAPYNVCLVELAEGPRMMSRVEGIAPDAVRIGMPVRARIDSGEGLHFVVFEPDTGQGHQSPVVHP
ncbi:MAG: Zn-ribbon domain-containing OB-fold protein [Gammaproteobacteria bacterium]